jgi:tetratricopeptide (TPR) repeat protein
LGKAAVELRGKLGESLTSVRRFDKPFEATSSSLEALRLYTMAAKERLDGRGSNEIALLQRAVELDQTFASGYAQLSAAYWNLRQTDKAAEFGKKGFDLRANVTERERFILLDRYYGNVLGDLEKLIESDKLWSLIYIRDYAAFAALGSAYGKAGQRDKGLEASLQAIRLNPDAVTGYVNGMAQYAASGQLVEARRLYEQARNRKLAYQRLAVFLYDVAFLQHDEAAMAEAAREAASRQGGEDDILLEQALVEAYSGRRKKARELLSRVIESAERRDDGSSLGVLLATQAHMDALFGEFTTVRRDAAEALKRSSSRNVLAVASWASARAGDRTAALAGEQQLQRDYTTDTISRRVYLPALRADRELAANQPEQAVEELRASVPYELASSPAPTSVMYVVYLRGEAYLRLRQGAMAAVEFEKIIQHPGIVVNSPLAPLARFGAAQAYALSGDVGKSRGAFEELFRVWKDADADLPVLLEARRQYAQLH